MKELARAGSEIVRITVNNEEAAKAVPHIRDALARRGVNVPIVVPSSTSVPSAASSTRPSSIAAASTSSNPSRNPAPARGVASSTKA